MLLLLEKQRDIPYIKILKSLQAIIGALTLCEIFLISKLSTHFSTTPNHRGGGRDYFLHENKSAHLTPQWARLFLARE